MLDDDPDVVVDALLDALRAGADEEQLGQAIAYAAALRIARFHIQNDHGDWDTVHHSFTAANALHHALQRVPTPELLRGACTPRCASTSTASSTCPRRACPNAEPATSTSWPSASRCRAWSTTPATRRTAICAPAAIARELVAALGDALLVEDAGFHWYQMVEAGVRQAATWPEDSEEAALVLAGVARFLAAHTPTRRELPTVVRIATRLRRGEALYEEA